MVKNTKTWMSWKQKIFFLQNGKIIQLCLRWHILRSCHFASDVTFKLSLISWVHILHGPPPPPSLAINFNEPIITEFSMSILSACPKHPSLVWHKASTILATIMATVNLFLNSADDFLSRDWHYTSTIPFTCQFENFSNITFFQRPDFATL